MASLTLYRNVIDIALVDVGLGAWTFETRLDGYILGGPWCLVLALVSSSGMCNGIRPLTSGSFDIALEVGKRSID